MKHLLTTALLCGAGILAGQAQNVVITDKDGIAHRFNADYVQEITFEKIQAGDGYDLKFDGLDVNPWGKRNITLGFTQGDETNVSLDIYQPSASYLQPGTYKVDPSYDDYTIDPEYSTITVDGNKEELSSGDMIVSLNGETYTFDMDLTLASGQTLKGKYTGVLPVFGPVINFNLANCNYVTVNDPASNGFYYGFTDTDWKVEMRIELFSEGNAPAAGVYTFSDTMKNGTASSYINLYSPYNETTNFTEGTVTLSGEGDDVEMVIEGTLGFGMPMKAVYKGKLPERPSTSKEYNLNFDTVYAQPYGTTNIELSFNAGDDYVKFDMYQPSTYYVAPGVYTIDGNGDFYIDPYNCVVTIDYEAKIIKSGTVTVTLDGDLYTVTADVTLEDGDILKGTYTGLIRSFGPAREFYFSNCKYVEVNDPAANGFYYGFNDKDWVTETRIELFSEGNAPAAGVYTFSETMENGTASSYVNLYSPYNEVTKFTEGTVSVSGEGAATVIVIEGTLEIGLRIKATYQGELPARN